MGLESINSGINKTNKAIVSFVATIIGLIHVLNVSGALLMSTLTLRILHLMAMMVIVLLGSKKDASASFISNCIRILLSLLACISSAYLLTRWVAISTTGGETNQIDMVMAIIMVALVLEVTRRTVGTALSIIALVFLVYPFIASYMPGILRGRTYSVSRIFNYLYTTADGLYGIPISTSATYIILFCIYGSFLSEFGAADILFKLSVTLTRKFVGAAAKTTIIFNMLVGLISGSSAANVAITGNLVIPMMTGRGHSKENAGAITAAASVGAILMPPVMGAAAFIMAEITGNTYLTIMKSAIVPAVLFYVPLLLICTYEAKKNNYDVYSEDEKFEKLSEVLKDGWYYLVPILILIIMLVLGYSPFKAAYYSCISLIVVYFAAQVVKSKGVSGNLIKKTLLMIISSIKKGAIDTGTLAIACAASGIIVGVLSITGLGSKLSQLIILISGGQVLIALLLTMIVTLILGLGLPTTAAYLVMATVVVPALVNMGIPLIAAHMFVFFFGAVAGITPPVALASYVAAGIAKADVNIVSWTAVRYCLASFVLPFMFIYNPSLLMDGSPFVIIRTVILSIIGTFCIAIGLAGFFKANVHMVQRVILFIGGFLLIDEGIITDIVGIVILISFLILNHIKARRIA